jgi:pteridine reductase
VQADLAEPTGASTIVEAIRDAFGRLDVLINNAATFDDTPLADVDAERWDAVMDVNVRAPHLLVRAAADLLRASEGCVINLADLSAWQAWSRYPVHAVSKAALVQLTRVQARALAPDVRVNAIAPGAVLPPDDFGEEEWAELEARTPLARAGTPDDVVRAALFLADSPYVTGAVIPVDGGRLLGPSGPPGS